MKKNQNQVCWLMQKARRDVAQQQQGGFSTFQQFLDNQQYTRRGILRYEKMFGSGYVSTGGPSTTKVRNKKWSEVRSSGGTYCWQSIHSVCHFTQLIKISWGVRERKYIYVYKALVFVIHHHFQMVAEVLQTAGVH